MVGKGSQAQMIFVIKMHSFNAVINCIPCLPLPRQKQGLTRRFTEYCVPADTGPTLCLCREIFPSKGLEIYYAGMSTYAGTITKGTRGYGAGTYPGIYQKMSPAAPGTCTLDITKYKIEFLGKSPLTPGSGEAVVTIDSLINCG